MISLETIATFYADVLMNNTWDLKLTSNWSRAEVGALRNAKKEFCESWCFTPTNERILFKDLYKFHKARTVVSMWHCEKQCCTDHVDIWMSSKFISVNWNKTDI